MKKRKVQGSGESEEHKYEESDDGKQEKEN